MTDTNTIVHQTNVAQLKIYALFMWADGDASGDEKKILEEQFAKNLELSTTEVIEVYNYCQKIHVFPGRNNSGVIMSEIDKVLEANSDTGGLSHLAIDRQPRIQTEIIWNLMNLARSDGEASESEQEVIDYLVQRWSIKPVILQEFNDSIETLGYLVNQEKNLWKPHIPDMRRIDDIKKRIAWLTSSVQETITFANHI